MKLMDKETDQISKKLLTDWKEVGEKKHIEDAYRYLMKHGELLEYEKGKKAYDFLGERVVQIWCQETNTQDVMWMRKFIDMLFRDQIKRTPSMAERGKQDVELLMKFF